MKPYMRRGSVSEQRLAAHHAIVSLMEEVQAMDWYRQRADDCDNAELRAVLVHNMNDEMEHAAMLVEAKLTLVGVGLKG